MQTVRLALPPAGAGIQPAKSTTFQVQVQTRARIRYELVPSTSRSQGSAWGLRDPTLDWTAPTQLTIQGPTSWTVQTQGADRVTGEKELLLAPGSYTVTITPLRPSGYPKPVVTMLARSGYGTVTIELTEEGMGGTVPAATGTLTATGAPSSGASGTGMGWVLVVMGIAGVGWVWWRRRRR